MTRSRASLESVALALACATLGLPQALAAEPPTLDAVLRDTLKGEARLGFAPEYSQSYLQVLPAAPAGSLAGATSALAPACGAALASAPVVLAPRDRYAKVAGAAEGMGLAILSHLASAATGGKLDSAPGAASQPKSPPTYEDPIKSKYRGSVKDAPSGIRLDMGAQLARDGILLSTRLDSVSGKGTVHEIYLERDDCRRIYPSAEYTYELWGSWSLSVSWTRTESTYENGKLLNQQTTSGGFTRQGQGLLAAGGGVLPLAASLSKLPPDLTSAIQRYQSQVQQEIGTPMWQRLGFAAPTSGARAVGALFHLSPADLEAIGTKRMLAIVQVTREQGPFYEAVGVPVALSPGKDPAHLSFASAAPARR